MPRFKSFVLVSMFLALSASVATAEPAFFANAAWSLRPVPRQLSQDVQTGRVGELLFAQAFRAVAVARLRNPLSIAVPRVAFADAATVVLTTETQFYQVDVGHPDVFMVCDAQITFVGSDVRRLRLCMIDRERDGVFDLSYWAILPQERDAFYPFFIGNGRNNDIAVQYNLVDASDAPTVLTLGVAMTRSPAGAYRLRPAATNADSTIVALSEDGGGGHREFRAQAGAESDAASVYFRPADVPLTLNVHNAQIEILRVEGDALTYRVLHAFDAGEAITVGYVGALPRP